MPDREPISERGHLYRFHDWIGYWCCDHCKAIRPARGATRDCRGVVKLALRDTEERVISEKGHAYRVCQQSDVWVCGQCYGIRPPDGSEPECPGAVKLVQSEAHDA